ncbi:MAG: SIMPL domain-containing protein [Bacteroidales bacterium]|nr:SIMPL domain-containing protein [Bacteroidales bacterium]
MKNNALIIGIVASVCFFLAAAVFGFAYYQSKKPAKTVSVVGMAQKDFTSDLIVWRFSFSTQDNNMKESYAQLKDEISIVKNFLEKEGITAKEMDFQPISTSEVTEYRWDEVTRRSVETFSGYNSKQTVTVTSNDIDKIEKVIRKISELYDQNILIDSWNPEYYYTKLSDLKIEMLAAASQNAKERAEAVTKNAGSSLGKLKSANMGVFQITAPNSADEDYTWGGAFNTSSKEKRATINTKLTYFVE